MGGIGSSRGAMNCLSHPKIRICYTLHMKIRIRYFASLREITGQNEELLMVDERTSVADIRALLVTRYPRLQPILERSLCAVNRGYVANETVLHEGDELVFIPPMGGGNLQE
ncbi:MAG: MoaD/ThiS family protein [Chloroflexi bacterium]|nr:MAG: MoaD/ThiS family protein [Chloroflexota bacterium]